MSDKYNLVVLDGFTLNPGDLSWQSIEAFGKCDIFDRTTPQEIIPRCKNADIALTNKVIFDKNIIGQLPKLKYIAVTATGYNVVDVDAAKEHRILVSNIPAYSTDSVAQMVFAHILNITQNVAHFNQTVQDGKWVNSKDFCYWDIPLVELSGKTIGIIGFGRIGQKVAQIAHSFGMKILVNTRTVKNKSKNLTFIEPPELFKQSDFISLHCPLTPQTDQIINKENISLMKNGSVIINTGRGGLINEADLANALNNNKIAAACLDVLSTEPPQKDNPLLKARNCFITPHIAWATTSSRQRLMEIVTKNIQTFIDGNPQNIVNP